MNLAIVQARMGSTRLPGKVLMKIGDYRVLDLVVRRIKLSKVVDEIVIATSLNPEDDILQEFCLEFDVKLFRGSNEDVLGRFTSALGDGFEGNVLRVTADCPFVDPTLIDMAYEKFIKLNLDHLGIATGAGVANQNSFKYPDGLDSEWMTGRALYKADFEAHRALDREHVTSYIWGNPGAFKLGLLEPESDYSDVKLTVDTPTDLNNMNALAHLLGENFMDFGLDKLASTYRKGILDGKLDTPRGNENYEVFYDHEK
jgi:spore coat polysaccharide biosynthesis protein SpsF